MPFKLTGHLEAKTYEELPRNSQWGIERNDYQIDQRNGAIYGFYLNKLLGIVRSVDKINEFSKFIHLPSTKQRGFLEPCWFNWKDDREFARQHVNGCRPRGIYRVEEMLPPGCKVTNEDIQGLLPSGKTIESEIAAKRVFVIDTSILGKSRFCQLRSYNFL